MQNSDGGGVFKHSMAMEQTLPNEVLHKLIKEIKRLTNLLQEMFFEDIGCSQWQSACLVFARP